MPGTFLDTAVNKSDDNPCLLGADIPVGGERQLTIKYLACDTEKREAGGRRVRAGGGCTILNRGKTSGGGEGLVKEVTSEQRHKDLQR